FSSALLFFLFTHPAPTDSSSLSLHDALPIWILIPYILVTRGIIVDHPTKTQVLYWLMWPAVAMIISSGLTSLLLRWRMLVSTFTDRKSTRLNSSHVAISYAVFCLKKKTKHTL